MKKPYYYDDILKICTDTHLTADDIFYELKKIYPSVGISTVYRNLEDLVKQKKLKKITSIGKKAYFEKNKGFHIHLLDKESGKIVDLEPKEFNINLPENFKVEDMEITILGKFLK